MSVHLFENIGVGFFYYTWFKVYRFATDLDKFIFDGGIVESYNGVTATE